VTESVPVIVENQHQETPLAGGGTSYYCAVGTFIPFDDKPGWVPKSASYTSDGQRYEVAPGPHRDRATITYERAAACAAALRQLDRAKGRVVHKKGRARARALTAVQRARTKVARAC
jgi:hypothetical protein